MLVGEDEAFTTEWDLVVARKKVGNQTISFKYSDERESSMTGLSCLLSEYNYLNFSGELDGPSLKIRVCI